MLKRTFPAFLLVIFLFACNNNNTSGNAISNDTIKKTTPPAKVKTILFFGNSLTAGYGLDDPSQAFPGLIQEKIDSLKLPYKTINAGLSGETTAGGLSRIDWLLKQKVDIFVLELGANDGLRGIPAASSTKNLQAIVDKVKGKYPAAKLVMLGMEVPPNMGDKYQTQFRGIFRKVAEKNKMAFVPFLLEGVAGIPKLNQQDGIHPTPEGQKIVVENVWKVLKGML